MISDIVSYLEQINKYYSVWQELRMKKYPNRKWTEQKQAAVKQLFRKEAGRSSKTNA